jgi:5-oxoprolinase (ATP-hydrolysing)
MPPFSKNVEEEGVLIDNVKLVENGRMLEKEMRDLLAAARYPARNPDQNIADLRAQVAANEKGVQELRRDGGALRPRRREGVHGPRPGQRRRVRAAA